MKRATATTLAALYLCSTMASAQEIVGIISPREFSCGKWTMDTEERRSIDSLWIDGLMSGYNIYAGKGERVDLPDDAAASAWITNYCSAHPLNSLVTAGTALVVELRLRRGLSRVPRWSEK